MEQHVHLFNGKNVLEKGKAKLIGPGTKPRNFVCAEDVARLAVRAWSRTRPPFRRLEIGGPGHYSNADVAALYARTAGIAAARLAPAGRRRGGALVLVRPLHRASRACFGSSACPTTRSPSASRARWTSSASSGYA
jgi:nucleoside-diphosphate-sugar epimerase